MSALFWFGVTIAIGGLMVWCQDKFPEVEIDDQRQELEDDIEQCGMHLRERLAAIAKINADGTASDGLRWYTSDNNGN